MIERAHLNRPSATHIASPAPAAAPLAAADLTALTSLRQRIGNQAVQRLIQNGQFSAAALAARRPALGNQAIQRLLAASRPPEIPRTLHPTPAAPPAEPTRDAVGESSSTEDLEDGGVDSDEAVAAKESMPLVAGTAPTEPAVADAAPTEPATALSVQRVNQITSYTAPTVDDPLDVLKTAFPRQDVVLDNQVVDPRHPPSPYASIHPHPRRVEKLTATLDGFRRGGPRTSDPVQTAYGHLGEYERSLFGRRLASTYRGGHLIADEMLGSDSYVEENFAPQHVEFNSPAYRVVEEMADLGPVHAKTNSSARTDGQPWTMLVELTYDADYTRTVADLQAARVIPSSIMHTAAGATRVTFPRRVPHSWTARLVAPAGYVFPRKQVTGPHQLTLLHGTASQTRTRAPLTRTRSNLTLFGMESLVVDPSSQAKYVGGNQVEEFHGIQSQPEPTATQPAYNPAAHGLPAQPTPALLVPQPILKVPYEIVDIFRNKNGAFDKFYAETAPLGMTKSFLNDRLIPTIQSEISNYTKISIPKSKLLAKILTAPTGIRKRSKTKKKLPKVNDKTALLVKQLMLDPNLRLTRRR